MENNIQYLSKDQVNGLISTITINYIQPQVESAVNNIIDSDEAKSILDTFTSELEAFKTVAPTLYSNLSIIDLKYELCNVLKKKYNLDKWEINNKIKDELHSRLQLISASNFDDIIKEITSYIPALIIKLVDNTSNSNHNQIIF